MVRTRYWSAPHDARVFVWSSGHGKNADFYPDEHAGDLHQAARTTAEPKGFFRGANTDTATGAP